MISLKLKHAKELQPWKMEKDYSRFDDMVMLQVFANLTVTYMSCGGHTKADMNKFYMNKVKKELEDRGVKIPKREELYEAGFFNGAGSW